jgi:hypothetical protein
MRNFCLYVFVIIIAVLISPIRGPAYADEDTCNANDKNRVDDRKGAYAGLIDFDYESRVEKYSSTAYRYIWCVINKSQDAAAFQWGDQAVPNRYFDAIVLPRGARANVTTHSRPHRIEERFIRFRSLGSTQWRSIAPQTIFPNAWLGDGLVGFQQAKLTLDEALNEFRSEDGLVDVVQLSKSQDLFRQFVEKERELQYSYSTVATIPVNSNALNLVRRGTYEKYDPADFASLKISLTAEISKLGSGIFYTARLSMAAETPEDAASLARASQVPLLLNISAAPGATLKLPQFQLQQKIGPMWSKTLLDQPVGMLSYSDLLLKIIDSNSRHTFFTMPITLLMPTGRGS